MRRNILSGIHGAPSPLAPRLRAVSPAHRPCLPVMGSSHADQNCWQPALQRSGCSIQSVLQASKPMLHDLGTLAGWARPGSWAASWRCGGSWPACSPGCARPPSSTRCASSWAWPRAAPTQAPPLSASNLQRHIQRCNRCAAAQCTKDVNCGDGLTLPLLQVSCTLHARPRWPTMPPRGPTRSIA